MSRKTETEKQPGPSDDKIRELVAQTPEAFWQQETWDNLRQEFGVPDYKADDVIDVSHWLENKELLKRLHEVGLSPRGRKVALESGGIPERLPAYLLMLIFLTGGPLGPEGLQFIAQPDKERQLVATGNFGEYTGYEDSLNEDDKEVTHGLIHKYQDRVLLLVTEQCAAYCRYCTRARRVGAGHPLPIEDLDKAFDYIEAHPDIREIILSGGDSFVIPKENFEHIVSRIVDLQEKGRLQSVRWGTRSFIHNAMPDTVVKQWHIDGMKRIHNPNIMLHINHPAEITKEVIAILNQLHEAGATFHSQSVLLNGVNNNRDTLIGLFQKIQTHGIDPYLMYLCDQVEWATHLMTTVPEAQELFFQIKNYTGGLVTAAEPVIDVAQGKGKIPLFSSYFITPTLFQDYDGDFFVIDEFGLVVKYDETKHEPIPEISMWGRPVEKKTKNDVTVFDGSVHG